MTRPFLVRAQDDALYVAKGRAATSRGLMAEWICAHLGRQIGLPIPHFTLLELPQELVSAMGAEAGALGAGVAFGSKQESAAQEFTVTQLKHVQPDMRRRLLAFDWWIENGDRSLSPHGV